MDADEDATGAVARAVETAPVSMPSDEVQLLGDGASALARALMTRMSRWGLRLHMLAPDDAIPGSYWGPPEAGLIGSTVYARPDTPLASLLHEICHWLCMDEARRAHLHTDAGGDVLEECAVCYLSVLVADALPEYSAAAMLRDMDLWGYSFRLGSAARWFSSDAEDARAWLQHRGLLDSRGVCGLLSLP